MSVFFKRILQIAENKGFKNITDFSKNGLEWLSSEKLNRLRKENNKPSIDILLEISNKFDDINLHWLITGKGEMLNNKIIEHLIFEEPKETCTKTEKIELDLLLKNNLLLKEQNQLQEEVIIMLREKVQFFEEKYNDCENQKKLLATSKKMD